MQTSAAHHSAEKETSARTLRDTQAALTQAKAETARNVGIVQELQNRLSAQFRSDSGRAIQDLKTRLFKQSQVLGDFEEENATLKKTVASHDGTIKALKGKIERADGVHAELKQTVDSLTGQLAEARDNLGQTLSSMSEAGSQSEEITAAWTREMEMQAGALKAGQASLTLEKERTKMLEERIVELRTTDSAEVERLKNVVTEIKEEIIVVKSQMATSEASHKAELKEAESRATAFEKDVADAGSKVTATKKMARTQMMTNKRFKEKNDELARQNEANLHTIDRLKSRLGGNASRQEESRLRRVECWEKLVASTQKINSHRKTECKRSAVPSSSTDLDDEIAKMVILQSQHLDVLLKIQKEYDDAKIQIATLEHSLKQAESLSTALQREADEFKVEAAKISEDAQTSIDEISKEAHSSILQNESNSKVALEAFELRLEESQSSIRTVSGLFANEAAKSARMEATIRTMEEEWRAIEQNHVETVAKMTNELAANQENEAKASADLQEAQLHLQNFIASGGSAQGTFAELHQRDKAHQERIADLETALTHALQTDDAASNERFTEQLQLAFSRIQDLEAELLRAHQESTAAAADARTTAAAAELAEQADANAREQLQRSADTIQKLEHALADSKLDNANVASIHASARQDNASSVDQLQRAAERIQELEIALAHSQQATAALTAISDASGSGSAEQLRVAVVRIQELEVSLLQMRQANASIKSRASVGDTSKADLIRKQKVELKNAADRILNLEATLRGTANARKGALSSDTGAHMTNSERTALQENIKFLKEALDRAQKQVEACTENLSTAQADTKKAEEEIEKAAVKYAEALTSTEKANAALDNATKRQNEDSECHAATVGALKRKVIGLEAKLAETASSTPDFERMLGELQKANADLRHANERATMHEQQCGVVQSQLNVTSNACVQLSMEHDALKTDFANLEAKFVRSEEKLAAVVAARTELENKMLKFAERLEKQAASEAESKAGREREVSKEMTALFSSRDEALKRVASSTMLNKDAEEKIAALEKEMYNASLNHIAVVSQLEAKNKELSEKTIYQGKTERHCVEEFAAALAEIDVLTRLKKEMEEDAADKAASIHDLEESVQLLTEELEDTRTQLLQVTADAKILKDQLVESATGTWKDGQLNTQRLHAAQLEVQKLSQKYSELQAAHSDLEEELAGQSAAHAERCMQFQSRLAAEEDSRATLNMETDSMYADKCAELEQVKAEASDQVTEAESTFAEAKQKLMAKLDVEMAETAKAHENAMSEMIYQHEEDAQALQQSLEDATRQHESDTADLKLLHMSAIDEQMQINAALVRNHDEELVDLRKTHQQLVNDLKDEHASVLNSLYDSHEEAIESLTVAHDTISETLEAELDASEEHSAECSRRAMRKQALLEADIGRLSEERGALMAELTVKDAEIEDLNSLVSKCKGMVSDREAETAELDQQIADLVADRANVKKEHEESTDTLEESLRSTNMLLLEKSSQLANLDTRILALTGEREHLNAQLTQATLHSLRDEQLNQYHDTTQTEQTAVIARLEAHAQSIVNERDALSQQLVAALEQPVLANALHKGRVAALESTIQSLTVSKSEVVSELSTLRHLLKGAQDDLKAAAKKLSEKENEHKGIVSELNDDKKAAALELAGEQELLARTKSALTTAEDDAADHKQLIDRIEGRLSTAEDERDVLAAQLSSSAADALRMSQMKMQLISEKEAVSVDLATVKETEAEWLALSRQKDADKTQLADEISKLRDDLLAAEAANATCFRTIEELEANILQLSGEMESKAAILERVEARYTAVEKERDELVKKMSSSSAHSLRVAQLQRLMLDGTEQQTAGVLPQTPNSSFLDDSGLNYSAAANSPAATTPNKTASTPGKTNATVLNDSGITSPSFKGAVNPFINISTMEPAVPLAGTPLALSAHSSNGTSTTTTAVHPAAEDAAFV